MKIIYLFTSPSLKGSSVQTKVLEQIRCLNLVDSSCRGVFFSTEVDKITRLNEFVELIPVIKCDWKYFRTIGQRRILDKVIYGYIKNQYNSTDIFYLRYPMISKGLYKIAKRFGSKIVTEYQGIIIPDIKSNYNKNPFGLKISKLLSWFVYYLRPIWQEKNWNSKYLSKILMATVVTSEIADFLKKEGCKNVVIIGNGIDVSSFPIHTFNKLEKELNIFMLVGSSSVSPSHGVDRIIKSVKSNNTNFIINLYIYSKQHYESIHGEKFNIVYRGYKNKSELDIEINHCHAAVGVVASFRKNYKTASALKVREYFSRGFPVIMSSLDADLSNNIEAEKYIIYVPNDESEIDFNYIVDKLQIILSDDEHTFKINKIAQELLTWKNKMKNVVEILKKC